MAGWEERVKQRQAEIKLAVYFAREFMPELGKDRALAIMEKAWIKKGVDDINTWLEGVPSEKRFEAFGEWLKEQAKNRPELKVIEASPKRIRTEISQCTWYDACENLGVPEISQKYCDSDHISVQAIHPKVKLIRDKKIAYGADYCNHCYVMEE